MQKEIKAAVNWWADVLASVNPKHDNGDPNPMAMLLMEMSVSQLKAPTDQQIERFKEKLTASLTLVCEDYWNTDNPEFGSLHRQLWTDYGPDGRLREAGEFAQLDHLETRFPMKTVMQINPGEVQVARGYGQPYITIYKADEILS